MSNLILEHEIPKGSRLYFGKTARKKREIEKIISDIFFENNFEEIVTPHFSFSGHQSIENKQDLITIADETNNQVALRADNTLDVVRIITKRLGRATNHKKWFYSQPVFTYPANEFYQIGAEWIEHDNISDMIKLNIEVLKSINVKGYLQVSNINLPHMISNEFGIDINLFKNGNISMLFDLNLKWLNKLLSVQNIDDLISVVDIVPNQIKKEVICLIDTVNSIDNHNTIVSPLYYSSMKYYNGICFRITQDNFTLSNGGACNAQNVRSLGFALCTDNLLKILGA